MRGFVDELSTIRRPIDDQDLHILILGGLGPRINSCICSLNRGDVNLDQAKSELLAYENVLIQQDKIDENQVYEVNYSNVRRGNKEPNGSNHSYGN